VTAPFSSAPPQSVEVPDVDWVARFREGFREQRAGAFLIVPSWRRPPVAPPGLRLLVVDPGRAFGTGTHETTRLCLAALEELAAAGPIGRTLDVGTGSGILAVAAAGLGAAPVFGADIDPEAVASARLHAALNGVAVHYVLADGGRCFRGESFDLVLANLTAPLLLERREELQALRATGGSLVLAGLLAEDLDTVRPAYDPLGGATVRTEGEWACLILRSAP
jgi:ribosomal protein L11 methyltransferase